MKQNRISYYFFEGIRSIFSHGFMSFASVGITLACLIIMGSFTLLSLNINAMVEDLQSDHQVMALVEMDLSDEEAIALEDELMAVENLAQVDFVSRDAAWEAYIAKSADKSKFTDFDASILRHRYLLHLENLSFLTETRMEIEAIPGIAEVKSADDVANGLLMLRNVVSAVSLVIVGLLLIVSLFITSNTIKLTTFNRREEIAIIKMVGATNSFIRWPFVFEGMFLGLTGSLLAYLTQWSIYNFFINALTGDPTFSDLGLKVIAFGTLAIPMLLIFIVVGLLVGIGGSLMAIRNYLRV